MPKRKKKKAEKQATPPSDVDGVLSRASMSELEQELNRRRRAATQLERKRSQLLEQVAAIDKELSAMGHRPPAGGTQARATSNRQPIKRRAARGGNTKTLRTHLEEVMSGQILSVSEAADAVIANGYTTTSKTFRNIVNQTLLAHDTFVKVDHGRYTMSDK